MKKDDFVTKDIESDIVALGYDGDLPVDVGLVTRWLHNKFPKNSPYKEGYWLWREDLIKEASLKYPFDDQYYDRRNHIVRLAIDEILKNIPEGNNVESINEIINEHGEKIIVKIENDRIFIHHEDCTDSFISIDELFINWILNEKEVIDIYYAVNKTLNKIKQLKKTKKVCQK